MTAISTILSAAVLQLGAYFFIGLLGVASHFLKQRVKGQSARQIKDWFVSNFRETVTTLIAFVVSFLIMVQTGDISYLTAFMAGYMADSLFSRVESNSGTKENV